MAGDPAEAEGEREGPKGGQRGEEGKEERRGEARGGGGLERREWRGVGQGRDTAAYLTRPSECVYTLLWRSKGRERSLDPPPPHLGSRDNPPIIPAMTMTTMMMAKMAESAGVGVRAGMRLVYLPATLTS